MKAICCQREKKSIKEFRKIPIRFLGLLLCLLRIYPCVFHVFHVFTPLCMWMCCFGSLIGCLWGFDPRSQRTNHIAAGVSADFSLKVSPQSPRPTGTVVDHRRFTNSPQPHLKPQCRFLMKHQTIVSHWRNLIRYL